MCNYETKKHKFLICWAIIAPIYRMKSFSQCFPTALGRASLFQEYLKTEDISYCNLESVHYMCTAYLEVHTSRELDMIIQVNPEDEWTIFCWGFLL